MESKQYCDNIANCHQVEVIGEDNNAIRVYCIHCGAIERIGKDLKGNPEHRAFGGFFKREIVQPDHPLYYKYAGAKNIKIL